ncbi:hypothetical protein PMAYCL1PPCAC_19257, partial [Pristionchus mayeri]
MRQLWIGLLLLAAQTRAAPTNNSSLLEELEKSSSSDAPSLFAPDCADPHNDHVKCTVHEAACDDVHAVPQVTKGEEPPEVHDLRIESYTKANSHGHEHQLHVDISWQMPMSNDSLRLKAFHLEVVPDDTGREPFCYLLRVSENEGSDPWVPRFHFSTTSLFSFSSNYSIRVRSLPRSVNHAPMTQKRVTMMKDPGRASNDTNQCEGPASKAAAKWTASFRRIFLNTMSRTINVQFVAAPKQYCFEQYEVRLLNSEGMELLHAHVVEAKDLKESHENGVIVYIGEHNFTDLEYDTDYIPSVLPVEASSTGKCLCPIDDASDPHGVCSCIAADWKKIRLTAPPLPTASATTPPPVIHTEPESSWWKTLLVVVFLFALIPFLICVAIYISRKYKSRDKLVRTRFVTDTQTEFLIDPRHPTVSCNSSWSVLIVYSHDSTAHEATVVALAEFLRDSFNIKVHIDRWEMDEIEENLHDYINNAVLRVDKVLIINSVGAYCRLQARSRGEPLERVLRPDPLDRLFEAQIDMALQHARVISMRFSYTPSSATLFSLSPLLQYSVPENLPLLLSALTENSARNDPRLMVGGAGGYDPCLDRLRACITRMQNAIDADPEWFENSHRRVPVKPMAATVPSPVKVAVPTGWKEEPTLIRPHLDSGIAESSFITDQNEEDAEPEPAISQPATVAADSGVHFAPPPSTVVDGEVEEEEEEEEEEE